MNSAQILAENKAMKKRIRLLEAAIVCMCSDIKCLRKEAKAKEDDDSEDEGVLSQQVDLTYGMTELVEGVYFDGKKVIVI